MFIYSVLKRIFRPERGSLGSGIKNIVNDVSYEYAEKQKEVRVYLSLDEYVDDVLVISINSHELLLISRSDGPIGIIKLKKEYRRDSVRLERKAKAIKVTLNLK